MVKTYQLASYIKIKGNGKMASGRASTQGDLLVRNSHINMNESPLKLTCNKRKYHIISCSIFKNVIFIFWNIERFDFSSSVFVWDKSTCNKCTFKKKIVS